MPKNAPENTPRITPYLYYEDVAGTLDWLVETFGFRKRTRMPGREGKIMHAEMELGDGVIMMGHPGPKFQNPNHLGQVTQSVLVYVDDVDQHFEHARAAERSSSKSPTTSSTATAVTVRRSQRGTSGTLPSTSAT